MVSKSVIAITALLASVIAVPAPDNERIVGGVEVSPKFKYPWLVSLQVNGRHSCGGIILNPTTVLTAAHCSQRPASAYTVNVHRHNLQLTAGAEQGQSIKVSKINSHPKYSTNGYVNDVSVWKLATAATTNIGSIELDDGTYGNRVGLNVIASGWGQTQTGGDTSTILNEVTIPIVDNQTCVNVWKSQPYPQPVNPELHVCAAAKGGKDACKGDSGGPLFVIGKSGKPVLIGTTSFGQPCAYKGIPTVWARTSAFRSFINQYL